MCSSVMCQTSRRRHMPDVPTSSYARRPGVVICQTPRRRDVPMACPGLPGGSHFLMLAVGPPAAFPIPAGPTPTVPRLRTCQAPGLSPGRPVHWHDVQLSCQRDCFSSAFSAKCRLAARIRRGPVICVDNNVDKHVHHRDGTTTGLPPAVSHHAKRRGKGIGETV